jgi:transcription initiation factor TFIID subunit 11
MDPNAQTLPAQLVNAVLQQSVSPSILTVVRGFAKVFVGEIVEKGESSCRREINRLTPTQIRKHALPPLPVGN